MQKGLRDSSAAALGHHALSCAIEQYHAAVLKSELAQAAVDASSATLIPTTTSGGLIPTMPTSQLSTKLTELGLPELDVADIVTPITKPGALPRVPLPGTAAYSKCVENCCRLHENLGHASTHRMMKFIDSGRNSFGLTSEMVKKCMPECRVCVTAAQMHRTTHTSTRAKGACEYLPGECFQLDDKDFLRLTKKCFGENL